MKKIYMLLGAVLVASSSFAQINTPIIQDESSVVTPKEQILLDQFSAKKLHDTRNAANQINKGPVNGRVDYGASLVGFLPGDVEYSLRNNIMPDSTTWTVFSNATVPVGTHAIGMVYDPTDIFFGPQQFTNADPVNVDTLFVDGVYYLNNVAHTNDSIIFSVFIAPANSAGPFEYTGLANPADVGFPNVATLAVPYLDYTGSAADGVHNGILGTTTARYGYRLVPDDSTGVTTIALETPGLTIPAGSVMGVYVEYFPTAFTPNDTFDLVNQTGNFNAFRPLMVSNINAGDPKFHSFTGLAAGSSQHNTISLNRFTRYSTTVTNTADSPNAGQFFPSSFSNSIYATVSGNSSVGINEEAKNVKFNVFPNPSNGVFNIYLSSNDDSNVNLIVKNVVGQTILTETVNVSGNTNHQISLTDYSKGIYFLTVGNETTKLIVE